MGFLKNLLSSGIKETADAAGGLATDIRNAVTGEATELKAMELEMKLRELQTKINEEEAKSGRFFVAGWRPAVGWACVLVILNNFIVAPYVNTFTQTQLPVLDFSFLSTVLLGMLGLVGSRTYEKIKGVQDKH